MKSIRRGAEFRSKVRRGAKIRCSSVPVNHSFRDKYRSRRPTSFNSWSRRPISAAPGSAGILPALSPWPSTFISFMVASESQIETKVSGTEPDFAQKLGTEPNKRPSTCNRSWTPASAHRRQPKVFLSFSLRRGAGRILLRIRVFLSSIHHSKSSPFSRPMASAKATGKFK